MEFKVRRLYVLQTSGQSQAPSWKRQKVNSIWHTGGPKWCIIHVIKPGNCNNWLATEKIYHTKLKYNTSSVTNALQKQHQSMWKCSTKKNSLTDLNLRLFWPWYECTRFKQEVQFTTLQSMDLKFQRKCCILSFIKSTNFKNTQNLHTLICNLKSLQPYTKLMWWVHTLPFCSNSYDGPHVILCMQVTYKNDHPQNNYQVHTRGHVHCWISNKYKALLQCTMTSFICCLTSEWNAVR